MRLADAQREVRAVYLGGAVGQLVAAAVWLASACCGLRASPRLAIAVLVVGGAFIFPLTQIILRLAGRRASLSPANPLRPLALEIAFTLPLGMLLLVPVVELRLSLFYPALMILVGAHYLPMAFLYGMREFLALGGALVFAGVAVALRLPASFTAGAWLAAALLALFALLGLLAYRAEVRAAAVRA
jgi:hypothetical protein